MQTFNAMFTTAWLDIRMLRLGGFIQQLCHGCRKKLQQCSGPAKMLLTSLLQMLLKIFLEECTRAYMESNTMNSCSQMPSAMSSKSTSVRKTVCLDFSLPVLLSNFFKMRSSWLHWKKSTGKIKDGRLYVPPACSTQCLELIEIVRRFFQLCLVSTCKWSTEYVDSINITDSSHYFTEIPKKVKSPTLDLAKLKTLREREQVKHNEEIFQLIVTNRKGKQGTR